MFVGLNVGVEPVLLGDPRADSPRHPAWKVTYTKIMIYQFHDFWMYTNVLVFELELNA